MFRLIASMWKRDSELRARIEQLGTDKRRFGRIGVVMLRCRQGEVLNVSGGGMRVLCKRRPRLKAGQLGRVRLDLPIGYIDMPARVVWARQSESGKWEAGFAFGDLNETQRMALQQIARFAADQEIVRPREAC